MSNFNSGKERKPNKKIIKPKKSKYVTPYEGAWGETEVLLCWKTFSATERVSLMKHFFNCGLINLYFKVPMIHENLQMPLYRSALQNVVLSHPCHYTKHVHVPIATANINTYFQDNGLPGSSAGWQVLTFWSRNYFLKFSTPVYKVWIIQEPNKL